VRKSYKGGAQALRGVDLCVEKGTVVCLAGPNGAGKTTLVRICATQLLPTAGDVCIFGVDIVRHPQKARGRIAVVPQEARPDPDRSAWHHAYYYARARGVGRAEAKRRSDEVLRTLGMWGRKDTVSRELSGGLRQRVLIAMAMVTQAPLLFLDEPTTGLDPVARREMWQVLGRLRDQSTVLLTTHYMEEAEVLADRAVILDQGRVLADDSPRRLVATLPYFNKVLLEDRLDEQSMVALRGYGELEELAGRYVLYVCEENAMPGVVKILTGGNYAFSVAPLSLEDYYIAALGGRK
jgi:ABC-2 type transport system ATP-binding protein